MTFNSLQFVVFLAVVLLVYYRFRLTGQNALMVVAGAVFYAIFDWRFLFLLYGSTLIDWTVGRQLGRTDDERTRKLWVALSLVYNLGVLGFFKYFDFFAKSVTDVLRAFGLQADPFTIHVLLPVGISFYTFQSVAYVITVYRRELKPEPNLITFAAFVSWFPQLVAGPIERPQSLLPQVQRRRDRPSGEIVESGLVLILRGLFKKVVVADSVANFVNAVYASPRQMSWVTLVFATAGFAMQVYGDFSGYSDIARGTSRLLGVELRRNFEQPFLSRDIQEFWLRWHTALSWWFREYVGRPMQAWRRKRTGRAAPGPIYAVLIVLVIFIFTGLWHGAAWTFVAWGLFNGVLVAFWRLLPPARKQHPMKLRLVEIPRIILTFGLFCLGVVFFRGASVHLSLTVIKRIVTFAGGTGPEGRATVLLSMFFVLVLDLIERRRRIQTIEGLRVRAVLGSTASPAEAVSESMTSRTPAVVGGLMVAMMLLGLVIYSGGTPTPFIYFQF
jgi:D-alanyl-lipoteichoic acid acyltransferase DltB (MBOAT superfamily)